MKHVAWAAGAALAAAVAFMGCGAFGSADNVAQVPVDAPDSGRADVASAIETGTDAAQSTPTARTLFVTQKDYAASEAVEADARCAEEAKGKLAPTKWAAWVAFSNKAPMPAVGSGAWRTPTGRLVADSTRKLADGVLRAPIDEAPDGSKVLGEVWTGLTSDGTLSANCEDWTATAAESFGATGTTSAANISAIASATPTACNRRAHFYCFEVGPSSPPDEIVSDGAAPDTAKFVFVTKQAVAPVFDAAAANARCADEAKGKLAPTDWIAWVAFSSAPLPGIGPGPRKLPSGDLVADSSAKLLDGRLRLPIDRAADGTVVTGDVWTGITSDGTVGANCDDWTSNGADALGAVGHAGATDLSAVVASVVPCTQSAHLYCFEK